MGDQKESKKTINEEKDDFMNRWQKEFGEFEGSTEVSFEGFIEEMKRMMEFE